MKVIKSALKYLLIISVILIGLSSLSPFLPFPQIPRMLSVESGSMAPTLPVGSIVLIRNTKDIKEGDIISFKKQIGNTAFVTHRIQSIKDEKIYTKGDANNAIDSGFITRDQVVGKLFLIIPFLGYILSFAKTPLGIIIFIIIPAIIIILSEIKNIKKELSKKKEVKKIAEVALIILSFSVLSQKISTTQSFYTYQATLFRAGISTVLVQPTPSQISAPTPIVTSTPTPLPAKSPSPTPEITPSPLPSEAPQEAQEGTTP